MDLRVGGDRSGREGGGTWKECWFGMQLVRREIPQAVINVAFFSFLIYDTCEGYCEGLYDCCIRTLLRV